MLLSEKNMLTISLPKPSVGDNEENFQRFTNINCIVYCYFDENVYFNVNLFWLCIFMAEYMC